MDGFALEATAWNCLILMTDFNNISSIYFRLLLAQTPDLFKWGENTKADDFSWKVNTQYFMIVGKKRVNNDKESNSG